MAHVLGEDGERLGKALKDTRQGVDAYRGDVDTTRRAVGVTPIRCQVQKHGRRHQTDADGDWHAGPGCIHQVS